MAKKKKSNILREKYGTSKLNYRKLIMNAYLIQTYKSCNANIMFFKEVYTFLGCINRINNNVV